ncbi:MAG: 30S ribosomal protein S18 [Chloroflexota bacterium]
MANRVATKPRGKANSKWGGGRYAAKRKVCSFCVNHVKEIDYKNISTLSGYVSDRGKIESRRRTGTCARHQRALAMAIKRARHIALLPYAPEHIHRMGNVASMGTPIAIKKPETDKKGTVTVKVADTETVTDTATVTEEKD